MKIRSYPLLALIPVMLLLCANSQLLSASGIDAYKEINYVPNQGQWHKNVLFRADIPGGKFYAEQRRLTYDFFEDMAFGHSHEEEHQHDRHHVKRHSYQVNFHRSNKKALLEGKTYSGFYHNYFLGDDEAKWASQVPVYKKVIYKELYDEVDLLLYSQGTSMKYDFIVRTGGDPEDIILSYAGVDDLELQDECLRIETSVNSVIEAAPYAYQWIDGKQVEVPCRFRLKNKKLSFELPESYDKSQDLIIDPLLIFASYSGSFGDNWGFTATYDAADNFYGGGVVFETGYPTTIGAMDENFSGIADIGISKLNPLGSQLLYSTYLGGSSTEVPHSLIVDENDELVILGTTSSSNFPTSNGCYDGTFNGGSFTLFANDFIEYPNGSDIVVSKISSDGSQLLASTYLGGSSNDGLNISGSNNLEYNYGDSVRGEVITDGFGNIFIASCTRSTNFPTANPYQPSKAGDLDAVFAKFSPDLSNLQYSTYFGGDRDDAAYSIKLDISNNLVGCGGTNSDDLPTTIGALNPNDPGGSADGFVCKISPNGSNLVASTYIGTSSYDQCYFVETDPDGFVYTYGQTRGNYPVSQNVYSNPGGKQFVHKLSGNLTGSEWSTVFGSGGGRVNISPTAFLVDECGNIYMSGWGGVVNETYNDEVGNTNGMATTPDAIKSNTDGSDFYFIVLSKTASDLIYASYYGESNFSGDQSGEHVDGGTSRFSKSGIIYQAVCAGCGGSDDFPTTNGALSEVNNSNNCNLGMIKIAFDLLVEVEFDEFPTMGCEPFTVPFDKISDGVEFYWEFGDGSTSTEEQPTHTYEEPGIYSAMVVGIDSNTCNIRDTAYIDITVIDDFIEANIFYEDLAECGNLQFNFANNSINAVSHLWDFGDGGSSNQETPSHVYAEPGTYDVDYIVFGPDFCDIADTASVQIVIPDSLSTVQAILGPIPPACAPIEIAFDNQSLGADNYYWDLGDGTELTTEDVSHLYDVPGEYTVTMIAERIPSCNDRDTISVSFEVFDHPEALFTYSYDDPNLEIETLLTFDNLSSDDAIFHEWDFGDGTTSTDFEPTHFYQADGIYTVCLRVVNAGGCDDVYCLDIEVRTETWVALPNAFSPNNDGHNDLFRLRGNGIRTMAFRIFNRWGEKVFEGVDLDDTWDGTYKGTDQEMEVYVYTLDVLYKTQETFVQKGNITLIR